MRRNGTLLREILLLVMFLFPTIAFAHAEADATGFVSGFMHPLKGMDHLLAMLGVGLISARINGHYLWSIPAIFVTFMVIGGTLGAVGVAFPMVERGIALSVIVIGIAIAFVKQTNMVWITVIMAGVALFGSLHGYAHGVEMPNSASPVYYSFGFVVCTSTIHLTGVSIGFFLTRMKQSEMLPTYLGSAVALAGCYIMYGLVAN